ncbi:putative 3-phosphoserine phosphatase [Kalaharituber pfeilii]|nr:putative 3-phosphoserine phosphatase [Kalaharituber pfeilii]
MSPAMADATPRAIVFSDFDGTITLKDSNDYLTDNIGYGEKRRRDLNLEVLHGNWTFRDAFKDMLDSIKTPFPECIEILRKNIKLDPGFKPFYEWCLQENIPVIVLSSGMEPIIRALLTDLVGPSAKNLQIISNQVDIHNDGSWNIVFRDPSDFGHDKSLAIKPYNKAPQGERPTLFYCGDGVSDLSAARETDLLFAKHGHDLITYCEREGIPFTVFHTFEDIHKKVKDVVEGKTTTQEVAAEGKIIAHAAEGLEKEQITIK